MSNNWSNLLNQTLARLKSNRQLRIAVVGVGNQLYGDDAAGIMVAQALQPIFAGYQSLLILDGGLAPENQTGVLRRFAPDIVILLDAAQMDEASGTVKWVAWQQIDGLSASTHTLPLSNIAQYLNTEFGCEVALIGIQPEQMELGADQSPTVKQAVTEIVQALIAALK